MLTKPRPGIWLPPRRAPCIGPERFEPVCARNTPPSLISYTATASFITTGASKSTPAAVAWNAGDVIAVIGLGANAGTLGVPTATGLTFLSQFLNTAAATCQSRGAAVVAGAGGSQVISMSNSSGVSRWGFSVWVWRGSDGIGNPAEQHTATKTKSLTPIDTHSAVMWCSGDFNADATGAGTPAATNTRENAVDAAQYTRLICDLVDQSSGSAVSYGQSGGGTVGPFSIGIMEVLGTTTGGASTQQQLPLVGVGS